MGVGVVCALVGLMDVGAGVEVVIDGTAPGIGSADIGERGGGSERGGVG